MSCLLAIQRWLIEMSWRIRTLYTTCTCDMLVVGWYLSKPYIAAAGYSLATCQLCQDLYNLAATGAVLRQHMHLVTLPAISQG